MHSWVYRLTVPFWKLSHHSLSAAYIHRRCLNREPPEGISNCCTGRRPAKVIIPGKCFVLLGLHMQKASELKIVSACSVLGSAAVLGCDFCPKFVLLPALPIVNH
jgi:hypothetical protein